MIHKIPDDASIEFLEDILQNVLNYARDAIEDHASLRLGRMELRLLQLSDLCQEVVAKLEEVGKRMLDAHEKLFKELCGERIER